MKDHKTSITILFCISVTLLCACEASGPAAKSSTSPTAEEESAFDKRLYQEAAKGDQKDVEARLERGASINGANPANGWTALHVAAFNGHKKLVAYLVSAGADPGLLDPQGNTPLHLAAAAGHGDTTAVLVAVTDLSIRNSAGKTARESAIGDAIIYFPAHR